MKNYILLLFAFTFSAISYSQTCPPVGVSNKEPTPSKVWFFAANIDADCNNAPATIDIDGSIFNWAHCEGGQNNTLAVYTLEPGDPEIANPLNFTVTWVIGGNTIMCTYVNGVLGDDSFDIESAISISPNPVANKEYFNIKLKENMSGSYTLYNSLGQATISNTIDNSDFERVNTSNLSQGIYILNIKLDGKAITRKIIIDN